MSKLATAAFVSLMAVAGLIAYRVAEPRQLVTEADNRDLWETIAAGEAAQAAALTPSPTAYYTRTPTKTPRPATSTPYPTYGAESKPGIYLVPAWTPTSTNKGTVEAENLVPCITVTPNPYRNFDCEVTA